MKKSVLQNIKSAFNLSYLALIVLFCFAISTSFMSINYVAKYLSTDSGFDGARAAKFDVSVTAISDNSDSFYFDSDSSVKTGSWSFSVTSDSDVSVEYDVVLTLSEAMPEDNLVSLLVDGKKPTINSAVYTFENVGTFDVGNNTNTHTLTLEVLDFWFNIDTNIKVDVVARQID